MLFKVEQIYIPEGVVRILMKKIEFDEFLISNLSGDNPTIYELHGARFLFFEDNFVIEEQLEKWYLEIEILKNILKTEN